MKLFLLKILNYIIEELKESEEKSHYHWKPGGAHWVDKEHLNKKIREDQVLMKKLRYDKLISKN